MGPKLRENKLKQARRGNLKIIKDKTVDSPVSPMSTPAAARPDGDNDIGSRKGREWATPERGAAATRKGPPGRSTRVFRNSTGELCSATLLGKNNMDDECEAHL